MSKTMPILIVILALVVGVAGGWYIGKSGDSATTLAALKKDNQTAKDKLSTLEGQLASAQKNADALKADKQQAEEKYNKAQAQIGLLEDGLAIYTAPHDLVVAYAGAIKNRNGAAARAYLAPAIKDTYKPELLGAANPHVSKYEIKSETKGKDPVVETAVVRFFDMIDGQGDIDYHDDTLTIGKGSDGRFLITEIKPGTPVPVGKGK